MAKAALEGAKERLEAEVAARTAELRRANAELQRELEERLKAKKILQENVAKLELRNRELDTFARTVAHDLRDPLNVIVGFAELIADEAELSGEYQQCIQNIVDTGHRMAEITRELLLLSRLRDSEVRVEPVDMAIVVKRARARLVRVIEDHDADIVVANDWPRAVGYGPWLEEVWVNYLSNAIKYGGRPPRIELGATRQQDGHIRFWITDNGAGLSPKEREMVFSEFIRLDDHQAKGHGLGLSIVKRIVDKLNGQLGIDSAPGVGSTFYFALPAAEQPGAP